MATIIITDDNAGNVIVNDGDTYVIDPSLSEDVTFVNPGGADVNFNVQFDESNPNGISVGIGGDAGMNPSFSIGSGVDAGGVTINAGNAASSTVNAGDDSSLGSYNGSAEGPDNVSAGDNFNTATDVNLGDGENSFTTGDNFNANGSDIDIIGGDDGNTVSLGDNSILDDVTTGAGDDSVDLGSGSSFGDILAGDGGDAVTVGDAATGGNVDLGEGDDALNLGDLGSGALGDISGGGGDDTLTTQTDPDDLGNSVTDIENVNVVCFARGTGIMTEHGECLVEDLSVGDMVLTADDWLCPIRWIGSRKLDAATLQQNPRLLPIRIAAGALGNGRPERDLLVSPQHRILARSRIAQRMFSATEVLVAAKHLLGMEGVSVDDTATEVEYFHFLFDKHQVVFANGTESESLHTGPQALLSMDEAARDEILGLFPELATPGIRESARKIPESGRRARQLVSRHTQQQQPLLATSTRRD